MSSKTHIGYPEKQGLYDPDNEKDSCGVGFVANMKGVPNHQIVLDALQKTLVKCMSNEILLLEV